MRDDTNCGIGLKQEILHVTGYDITFSLCSNHIAMNIYMYYVLQLTESYGHFFDLLVFFPRQKRSVQKHKLRCSFLF
jgi:hypothetical protein